jgi:hypothetical protein
MKRPKLMCWFFGHIWEYDFLTNWQNDMETVPEEIYYVCRCGARSAIPYRQPEQVKL